MVLKIAVWFLMWSCLEAIIILNKCLNHILSARSEHFSWLNPPCVIQVSAASSTFSLIFCLILKGHPGGSDDGEKWWQQMTAPLIRSRDWKVLALAPTWNSRAHALTCCLWCGYAQHYAPLLSSPLQMSDSYRCQHHLLTLLIMFICFSECASGFISCTSGFCWCSLSLPALQLHLFVSQSAQLCTCSLHVNEKCLTCSLHRKCV